MKINRLLGVFSLGLILVGLTGCSSATQSGANMEPAVSGGEAGAIKLPDSLYCNQTAVENRLTVNLAPLREALGNPAETLEVILGRSGRDIASLGKIGGGEALKDFAYVDMMPNDYAIFETSASGRFSLKVINAAGKTVAQRTIILTMQ